MCHTRILEQMLIFGGLVVLLLAPLGRAEQAGRNVEPVTPAPAVDAVGAGNPQESNNDGVGTKAAGRGNATSVPQEARAKALALAREARERAYAPYSKFRMGAAVRTEKGVLVPGALIENVSLGLSMCAERAALFSAVAQGAGRPNLLVLVAPRTGDQLTFPCGACLQVALELGGPDLHIEACDLQGICKGARVHELAPQLPYKPHN